MQEHTQLSIDDTDIEEMLKFLQQHQLIIHTSQAHLDYLVSQSPNSQHPLSWLLKHYLFIRIPLFHPDKFLTRNLPLAKTIMSQGFLLTMLSMLIIGGYLVSRQWQTFIHGFVYFYQWQGWLIFAIALVFSKILHELGHAFTAKYYQLNVASMGVAFMVMWPVLYTENSHGWSLTSKTARLKIGAAGMIVEIYLAIICLFLWSFLPEGSLKSAVFMLATSTWILTLIVNLNPLMRFDGYFLMSDALGVENLQERCFNLAKWKHRQVIFGIQQEPPETFNPKKQRLLIWLAWFTWLYRFFLFLGIALLVYHLFFKAAGILLMSIELIWFIGLPIYKELSQWQELRPQMQWQTSSIISASVLISLILALLTPWQQSLSLPAIIQTQTYSDIYSATDGKIVHISVIEGQTVKQGYPLIKLVSDDIEHKLIYAQQHLESLELDLSRKSTSAIYLEYQQLLKQQIASAKAQLQAQLDLQQQLQIIAPHDGQVVYLNPVINSHPWINSNIKLAKIIQPKQLKVRAYIAETQLQRLNSQSSGYFYPENDASQRIPVQLNYINTTPSQYLDNPYLSSLYEGDIASQENIKGQIQVKNTLYELLLTPTNNPTIKLTRIIRGSLIIEAKGESYFSQILRQIQQVFQRELGGF